MGSDSILAGIGISREDLLGGMPARRASTILYAIENLTQQLVTRSRRALARYQPAESAQDRERQFMDAVSSGRGETAHPAIQDLERYATEWGYMVPDVPDTQAAILHQMSERYALYYDRLPRLRKALGADTEAVAVAFQRQQHRDISTIWRSDIDWRERLHWWRARVAERLETMPPFWMAFSLTLTETVGGGMLAIPIALAWVGVPAGLTLLAVFGFISIVTVAALVEGIVRDGKMRYGSGYFGRLVENRLGRPGSAAMGVSMFLLEGVGLIVALLGFGTVLAEQTGLSPLIWIAVLLVPIIFVLRRESLDATIAAALLVGIAILATAGGMIVIGLANTKSELLAGGSVAAPAAGTSLIALVFGVLLYVYFGHTSAGNAARQVLRRDPSGRTLLWGNVAAMATAAVIYMLFVVAINGSVPQSRLAEETGTAIGPLEEVAGPVVGILGSIYVILAFGIGAIFGSLGLYMQANERLGSRLQTRSARLAVGALPVLGVFALVALMLVLNLGSFTGPLALVGALVVPLLGGVFPMLVLASARRRGERVPGRPMRWLGSWFVVSAVIALYLGGVIVQAVFIWSDPLERVVAIATALAMAALIVVSVRRGSFVPRTVAELRSDEAPGGGMTVSVVTDGRGVSERRVADVAGNAAVDVELPAQRPDEVDVWAHRPTRDGDSEPIPVDVEVPDETHLVARPVGRWLPTG